jgi:hypothetical protein
MVERRSLFSMVSRMGGVMCSRLEDFAFGVNGIAGFGSLNLFS